MNLLSIKRGLKSSLFFLFLLFLQSPSWANDSIPDDKFLEVCKKAEAYLLHSYTDVIYEKSWGGFRRQTTMTRKMVINNNAGVDKFAFVRFSEDVSNHIKSIDVKTLKADGTVVKLDSTEVFQKKSKDDDFGDIEYPIPGVEPGDTILASFSFTEHLKKRELKDFVNLYAEIPSINSEFTIKTSPEMTIRYKNYNGFPEPQVVVNDSLIYCVFKMDQVKGMKINEYSCLPCEQPYFYYAMETDNDDPRSWKEVYNQEFNFITQPISIDRDNISYYKRWKRRVLGEAKDSSRYHQFELLHKEIIETMAMGPAMEEEVIKPSGYFLKEHRFDPISIRRLYRHILEDLEIKYWAVFARSRTGGSIDPYYIRKGEFDHIFFAYEKENGALNLLYPHEEYYKYDINEIPTSIYGTDAVIAKPYLTDKLKKKDKFIGMDLELAAVDSVTTLKLTLPSFDVDHNYIKQTIYCDVKPGKEDQSFKYRFSISGGLSTELKSFFTMLDQNDDANTFYEALDEFEGNDSAIQIDTILSYKESNKKPFIYAATGEGTLKGAVKFLNDSIVSISLKELIQHSQVSTEEEESELNYYLDYAYKDQFMAIFKFQQEIELMGFDQKQIELSNDYGSYYFDIKVNQKKQVTLQSNYKVSKDLVPKEEYQQLKAVNDLTGDVQNKRLLIKLKQVSKTPGTKNKTDQNTVSSDQ